MNCLICDPDPRKKIEVGSDILLNPLSTLKITWLYYIIKDNLKENGYLI